MQRADAYVHFVYLVLRKISAMLDALAKTKPEFLKDVNYTWLNFGRIMNCLVVLAPRQLKYRAHSHNGHSA